MAKARLRSAVLGTKVEGSCHHLGCFERCSSQEKTLKLRFDHVRKDASGSLWEGLKSLRGWEEQLDLAQNSCPPRKRGRVAQSCHESALNREY